MKVAVVGAGVLGASTAYHLVRAGAEVVIVDPLLEGRATAAGAGIVCPWSSQVADPDWYALAAAGARYYPELVQMLTEDGQGQVGYRRVGALNVPAEPAELDRLEARLRVRLQTAPEAGTVSRLSPTEARALFPPLREGQAALHIAGAARVDGRRLAAAMIAAACKHGAVSHTDAASLVVEAGAVRGVRVNGAVIGTDEVVVTAGAWAGGLLEVLGLRLAVQPQRGQIIHLHLPGVDTRSWPVLLPMTSHYVLAFDDERVVIGATRESGTGLDYRVTAGGMADVLKAGLALAPGLASATIRETRIGFRPMGPDIRPLLGRVSGVDGLVIGNGLGASGLTIGPYAGVLLAAAALGQAVPTDLSPYDPLRG